jgi:drug/metabolite transporter (DMT)-like permease
MILLIPFIFRNRVALLGVLGSASAYITIRKIGKRVRHPRPFLVYWKLIFLDLQADPFHSIFYFSCYSVLVSVVIAFVMRLPPVFPHQPNFALYLVLTGVFGFFAQILLTFGLQREKAGRGATTLYIQVSGALPMVSPEAEIRGHDALQMPISMVLERVAFKHTMDFLSLVGACTIVGSALWVAFSKVKATEQDTQEEGA